MRSCFYAFIMCQSMFCAIPCPWKLWDESARGKMPVFLPVIGLELGGIWALLAYLAGILHLPAPLRALVLCLWLFIGTGFLHLDGFMDVTDAVKSWRDLEERRRILKDPHSGSFAVIACVLLILTQFALFAGAKETADFHALILIPTASRAIAGLCVTALRPMSTSEYAGTYRKGVKKSHIVWFAILLTVVLAAAFLLLGKYGLAPLAVVVGYLLAMRRAFRSLDGMSGDISGYALTFGELCGIAVYALI